MTELSIDYDSPWKEIIERFFPSFLDFFFPLAYSEIDWTQPYEFLDTELQHLETDAEIGKRFADKVAKVWLLSGEPAWVLVHIEVQAQYDRQFAQRMYTYNYRLFVRVACAKHVSPSTASHQFSSTRRRTEELATSQL